MSSFAIHVTLTTKDGRKPTKQAIRARFAKLGIVKRILISDASFPKLSMASLKAQPDGVQVYTALTNAVKKGELVDHRGREIKSFRNLSKLTVCTEGNLTRCKNVGSKSVELIRRLMKEYGLYLYGEGPETS